jgi:hypothetical protein
MTAQAADRGMSFETWALHDFTLTSGTIAYRGAVAALVLGTGYVRPATGSPVEIAIGRFTKKTDASSATKPVQVELFSELRAHWYVNGASIVAADAGKIGHFDDDQTVILAPGNGTTPAGTILAIDSVRGVLVSPLPLGARVAESLTVGATLAFSSNDIVIPDYPRSGTVYDVPTTGAASTVSLPANAYPGTELTFAADGTKNGHTVTYRDVATAISAALTASKRHQARCVFNGTTWTVLTTVSP